MAFNLTIKEEPKDNEPLLIEDIIDDVWRISELAWFYGQNISVDDGWEREEIFEKSEKVRKWVQRYNRMKYENV